MSTQRPCSTSRAGGAAVMFFCLRWRSPPAWRRAGRSSSSAPASRLFLEHGSRGSRTYENITRRRARSHDPVNRRDEPNGAPAPAYAGGGSFFQRHPS